MSEPHETVEAGPDFAKGAACCRPLPRTPRRGEVLMMAYMNPESYAETLATGRAVYYSRSRKKLWRKGEESGNVQEVREPSTSIAIATRSC